MPLQALTINQLPDADAERALLALGPLPDGVLVALRNLQAEITDLTDRVTALEAP